MLVHALPCAVLRDVLGDVVRCTLGGKNGLAVAIGAQRDRKQHVHAVHHRTVTSEVQTGLAWPAWVFHHRLAVLLHTGFLEMFAAIAQRRNARAASDLSLRAVLGM